jgi:hypothetical protein
MQERFLFLSKILLVAVAAFDSPLVASRKAVGINRNHKENPHEQLAGSAGITYGNFLNMYHRRLSADYSDLRMSQTEIVFENRHHQAAFAQQQNDAEGSMMFARDCPKVYIYNIPDLWDWEKASLKDMSRCHPDMIWGTPCEDGTFQTNQYMMPIIVIYRLLRSKACKTTTDPSKAELFLVPAFSGPKTANRWDQRCRSLRYCP